MTPTDKLTVEQALDEAAREQFPDGIKCPPFAYVRQEAFKHNADREDQIRLLQVTNRAIELHTASAIAHFKQEVRAEFAEFPELDKLEGGVSMNLSLPASLFAKTMKLWEFYFPGDFEEFKPVLFEALEKAKVKELLK